MSKSVYAIERERLAKEFYASKKQFVPNNQIVENGEKAMSDGTPGDDIYSEFGDIFGPFFTHSRERINNMNKGTEKAGYIIDPLSVKDKVDHISNVLNHLASQENCDGEPYDQMVYAAEYIQKLEGLLYRMARIARNTDGLHPSTQGPAMGSLLLELRLMNGDRYAKDVM